MAQKLPKCRKGQKVFEICYQAMSPFKRNAGTFKYKFYTAKNPTEAELKWINWRDRRKGTFRIVEVVQKTP